MEETKPPGPPPGRLATRAAGVLIAGLVLAGSAGGGLAQPTRVGQGKRGTWEIVWSLVDVATERSPFHRVLGEDIAFPFGACRISDARGERIVFLDDRGDIERTIPLGPSEDGVVSADGSAYLLWTGDLRDPELRHFRFFQRDAEEPDWEATARGAPVLFAEDGSLFVMAERAKALDRFRRAEFSAGGNLQVVGAEGEIRGELPIYPAYARLTGDRRRIALLHDRELIVLGRDGRLVWEREVPLDQMSPREGMSQLEAAGGLIVVAGTGIAPYRGAAGDLRLRDDRRGSIFVFDDSGRLLWRRDQPDDGELWFQVSAALSPDGDALATYHSSHREIVVNRWDARTGELLWTQTASRATGFRSLSVAPGGSLIVLMHGAATSDVIAWDQEGTVAWEGYLPIYGKIAKIGKHDLLVFDRWVVRLRMDDAG